MRGFFQVVGSHWDPHMAESKGDARSLPAPRRAQILPAHLTPITSQRYLGMVSAWGFWGDTNTQCVTKAFGDCPGLMSAQQQVWAMTNYPAHLELRPRLARVCCALLNARRAEGVESNLHILPRGDSTTAWAVRVHRLKPGLPIGEPV